MGERLKDKVAIVVGAGSIEPGWSNGKATAVLFAREGARVFAVDRDAEAVRETREAIEAEGGEVAVHLCDVSQWPQVEAMAAACIARYGRIDVLFNNVGLQAVGGPLEVSEADWDRLMLFNVKSMYLTCKAVLPQMLAQGSGAIVNNSSLAAIRYSYPSVAYSASKGAVSQLTQNIGVQYAAKGIRCNAVLPGLMATPRITARLRRSHPNSYQEELAVRDRMSPTGRMGDGWDVAHAVLFLASDEARYVNAHELVVDGGMSASVVGKPWGVE